MKELEKVLLLEVLKETKTRTELCVLFNLKDCNMRDKVREIALEYPIISHSKKKGYRLCNTDELLKTQDQNQINKEILELEHTINEINSRIVELVKRKRPLLKALKKLKGEAGEEL